MKNYILQMEMFLKVLDTALSCFQKKKKVKRFLGYKNEGGKTRNKYISQNAI